MPGTCGTGEVGRFGTSASEQAMDHCIERVGESDQDIHLGYAELTFIVVKPQRLNVDQVSSAASAANARLRAVS